MEHDILSEFCIPASEITAALSVGEYGKLVLDVEVIGDVNGMYVFRKHNRATAEGNFRKENASDMRARILEQQDAEEDKTDPNDNPEE